MRPVVFVVCVFACACVRACVRACVCACVRAGVCLFLIHCSAVMVAEEKNSSRPRRG